MTTQLEARPAPARPIDRNTDEAEGRRLYESLARVAPATPYGLAREATLLVPFAFLWLDTQARAGNVHFDTSTGRYSPWCELPVRDE